MNGLIGILKRNDFEFFENFDTTQISSIKIGVKAKLVIFPRNIKEFEKVISLIYLKCKNFKVIGAASNILFVSDISYPLVVTTKMKDEIFADKNIVTVSAGMGLSRVSDFLRKSGLTGFEGLAGIPATIGGAIMNNAGAFGYNISDRIVKIKVFFKGKIFELQKNEIKFGYHFSNLKDFVILSATFLFENANEYDIISLVNKFAFLRSKSQPSGLSLGSVFNKVNGKSAGFYIERSGLKGTRVGGIVVSNKHSNFFINSGNGSAVDFLRLSSIVQNAVLKEFGVELTYEIEKVGNRDEITVRLPYSY